MLGGIGFVISFWDEDGKKYVQDTSRSHKPGVSHTKEILKSKVFYSRYTPRISFLTE